MIFKVLVDESTLTYDANGRIKLKLSTRANNGLSFDASGNLVATPGSSSGTGIYNVSGNAIGPSDLTNEHINDPLTIVGMNSTVSRHKKYTGSSAFIHNNDGAVMSKMTANGDIDPDCIAYYMIPHNNGGGE